MRPIVVCGPSGVGKGTLLRRLLDRYPELFQISVSHTTRDPRPGETHGKEYFFTSMDAMRKEIAQKKFIEFAEVHGRLYGTSCQAVEDICSTGKCCVLELDIQGAVQMRALQQFEPYFIFVNSPSLDVLRQRLRGRGTETDETMARRMETAEKELAGLTREQKSDPPLFDAVLVNEDFDESYDKFEAIMCGWARDAQKAAKTATAAAAVAVAASGETQLKSSATESVSGTGEVASSAS